MLWVLMLALLVAGGLGCTRPATTPRTQSREHVRARLREKLASDPNRQLCRDLVDRFNGGDEDALRPHFDHEGFVDRMASSRELPVGVQVDLRFNPEQRFPKFARLRFPVDSRFRCLGTRSLQGHKHLTIRGWTSTRFDYIMLHLSAKPAAIDDYMVVSLGEYHSESNAVAFSPATRAESHLIENMLDLSYEDRFDEIIETYRGLPDPVKARPLAFTHFVNAVVTLKPPGTPLYNEAMGKLDTVLQDRPYALAYWKYQDALGRGTPKAITATRDTLVDMLDDYELLEE